MLTVLACDSLGFHELSITNEGTVAASIVGIHNVMWQANHWLNVPDDSTNDDFETMVFQPGETKLVRVEAPAKSQERALDSRYGDTDSSRRLRVVFGINIRTIGGSGEYGQAKLPIAGYAAIFQSGGLPPGTSFACPGARWMILGDTFGELSYPPNQYY